MTSGELLYQCNDLQLVELVQNDVQASSQLRLFLDVHSQEQAQKRDIALANTLNVRMVVNQTSEATVKHIQHTKSVVIPSLQNSWLAKIECETKNALILLEENAKRFDSRTLTATLQYFSVLKNEIDQTSSDLAAERADKEALKRQAKVARDIMLFNCHLQLECCKKIELSILHHDSAQFQRCVRAVQENLQSNFHNMFSPSMSNKSKFTSRDVSIINVFKLRNDFLAKNLQV
jgi:hypothetical protein